MTPQQIHVLKTWPEYFEKVVSGEKTFEIRKNDRDFKVGDILHLKEWKFHGWSKVSPSTMEGEYTGREVKCSVTYVLNQPSYAPSAFGILSGYCIMSISLSELKEDRGDYVASSNNTNGAPVASHSCTSGNSIERCGVCGGNTVSIRGKYPKQPKRNVCPTCTYERLEQINEMSNPNYAKAYKNDNV